jgi:hypothetical protein
MYYKEERRLYSEVQDYEEISAKDQRGRRYAVKRKRLSIRTTTERGPPESGEGDAEKDF